MGVQHDASQGSHACALAPARKSSRAMCTRPFAAATHKGSLAGSRGDTAPGRAADAPKARRRKRTAGLEPTRLAWTSSDERKRLAASARADSATRLTAESVGGAAAANSAPDGAAAGAGGTPRPAAGRHDSEAAPGSGRTSLSTIKRQKMRVPGLAAAAVDKSYLAEQRGSGRVRWGMEARDVSNVLTSCGARREEEEAEKGNQEIKGDKNAGLT